MVAPSGRLDPRLFSRRRRRRPPLLDLPRRTLRPRDGAAEMVHARAVRMSAQPRPDLPFRLCMQGYGSPSSGRFAAFSRKWEEGFPAVPQNSATPMKDAARPLSRLRERVGVRVRHWQLTMAGSKYAGA